MVENNQQKTIAFVSDKVSEKFKTSLDSFEALTWQQQMQRYLEMMSLSMFDNLASKNQELPSGSEARALGHKTLSSFVTASHQNNGLDFTWDDWGLHAQAFRHYKEVNAQADSARQLIEDYANVAKHLGRKPVSSGEYARAMDALIGKKHKDLEEKYRKTIHDMQAKINDLMRCYNEEKSSSSELKASIAELNHKISDIRKEYESKMVTQEVDLRQEYGKIMGKERESFEREMAIELEGVEARYRETVAELQGQIDEVKGKYTEENFVSTDLYREATEAIERFEVRDLEQKDQISSLSYELSENQKHFSLLKDENGMQQDQINILTKRIEAFNMLYDQDVNPDDYVALQQEVETLRGYLVKGKTKYQYAMNQSNETASLNKKLFGRIKILQNQIAKLQKQIKTLKRKQKSHDDEMNKSDVKFKMSMSALAVATVLHFLMA